MDIRAGTNLGRYQLLAEIGRGAMGTVYQALDPEIDRLVAIKAFSAIDANSYEGQAFRERFAQEARAGGRLMHPGIVAIYDRGEEPASGTPYIVMEYVAGRPLSQLLTGSTPRLDERFALQLAREVADALAYAHEKGVIHRDIKPSNILVTEEGNAKIADFGVARLDTSNMTLHGQVLGTPGYMAPEQLMGGTIDGRADIFSLGVILYTMLIGFRPFQGNSAKTITFKVLNQEPIPITNFHLDLSKDSEYVVARAMAKNPADRYQTGTAFANDVGDILEGRIPRSRDDSKITVIAEVFEIAQTFREAMTPRSQSQTATSSGTTPTSAGAKAAVALAHAIQYYADPTAIRSRLAGKLHSVGPILALVLASTISVAAVSALIAYAYQSAVLHDADRKLGLPPMLKQRMAVLAISGETGERVIYVSIPTSKAPGRKEPEQDLDYTVVHTPKTSKPAAQILLASASASRSDTLAGPWHDPLAAKPPVTLELALQHHFAEAEISVWVDDKLVFSGLAHGEAKKRLFVLHGAIQGRESHEIKLPVGPHEIKVRVQSKAEQYDQSGTVHSTFVDTQKEVLDIRCNKRGIELKLNHD